MEIEYINIWDIYSSDLKYEIIRTSLFSTISVNSVQYRDFLQEVELPVWCLSKATEKVVAARLNSYLDDNNLHELLQSTYKQGHSTEKR